MHIHILATFLNVSMFFRLVENFHIKGEKLIARHVPLTSTPLPRGYGTLFRSGE